MKKRKGIIQPGLIVVAVLIIGIIIFTLSKLNVIEKDSAKEENQVVANSENKEQDKDEEELIDDVELEEDEEDYYDIEVGKKAADFTLKNLKGQEVSLSDYEGKIVLLNFWTTTCPFCIQEMPDMQKLSDENEDLVVLAVDVMEDEEKVRTYIEEGGYDFEVILDEKGDLAKTYLISAYPTTYFVDKEGILLGRVPGMMTWPQMNDILDNIRENE